MHTMGFLGLSKQTWLYACTTFLLAFVAKIYIDFAVLSACPSPPLIQQEANKSSVISGSSAWCTGTNHTDRMCRFKNLCYSTDRDYFVFFHGNESVLEGVPENRHNPTLLDFSSLKDHSAKYFNYVDLPISALSSFNVSYVERTSLLLSRFHPDNIMHVFHDDLLPLWYTLKIRTNFESVRSLLSFQLIFMDDNESSEFMHIYQLFSKYRPIVKKDLIQSESDLICFKDAFVGLLKTTVWYDYGFKQPQHPVVESKLSSSVLKQFTKFVVTELSVDETCQSDTDYIVLITRKYNRVILNEFELTFHLTRAMSMKVIAVSLETHSVKEIIQLISCAKIVIGMHGSLLVLGMFLKPQSILLELFPYAVNPGHYTPYKSMIHFLGGGTLYKSLRNMDVKKTVTHPDDDSETGGIGHLSKSEQLKILFSGEVPRHTCCSDPEWLFRIYQDTSVNVDEIVALLKASLDELSNKKKILSNPPKIVASVVQDLTCVIQVIDGTDYFHVQWSPPWNLQFVESASVRYEVWVQEPGVADYKAYITSKSYLDWEVMSDVNYVWVKCIVNTDIVGPLNAVPVKCSR